MATFANPEGVHRRQGGFRALPNLQKDLERANDGTDFAEPGPLSGAGSGNPRKDASVGMPSAGNFEKGNKMQYVMPRPGMRPAFAKQDDRPAVGLWCPGEYLCKCVRCGDWYVGDKLAMNCADCAYSDTEKRATLEER